MSFFSELITGGVSKQALQAEKPEETETTKSNGFKGTPQGAEAGWVILLAQQHRLPRTGCWETTVLGNYPSFHVHFASLALAQWPHYSSVCSAWPSARC